MNPAARVTNSKNRNSWMKRVDWSYRRQPLSIKIVKKCTSRSTIQLNLWKLLVMFWYLHKILRAFAHLGCSILPKMQTSSRWGCQTAWIGVNHGPVKLLWLMDLMPVSKKVFIHFFFSNYQIKICILGQSCFFGRRKASMYRPYK